MASKKKQKFTDPDPDLVTLTDEYENILIESGVRIDSIPVVAAMYVIAHVIKNKQ